MFADYSLAPGKKVVKIGLCQGRHEIAGITEYVFPQEVDPLDVDGLTDKAYDRLSDLVPADEEVHLYVTGLTVALVAVINWSIMTKHILVLWHFDRNSGDYYPQGLSRSFK